MNLSYRQKGLKKETKRRIYILIVIFLASFLISVVAINFRTDVFILQDTKPASLPTLSIESQGEEYGEFFGYKTKMNLGRLRNGLIPLNSDREVTYYINTYNNEVEALSYQISTGDGKRNITKGSVESFDKEKERISSTLHLSNLIEEGKEYIMEITLKTKGEELNYYSRIKYVGDDREKECVEFAKYFMETALSGAYEELAVYMEPSGGTGLEPAVVSIKSSLGDVGWVGFPVGEYTKPSLQFAEIDTNYTALELDYIVEGIGAGHEGIFHVNEYYRMRKGEERIYLLDFERTLTEVINGEDIAFKNNILELGQNGNDIDFITNQTGTNIAFTWNGGLYEYSASSNSLERIFYMGTDSTADPRKMHNEYDIRILDIDENGGLSYAAFGYMNEGEHEGYCGIGLYQYNHSEGYSTELAFLETDLSYSALKAGFDDEIYLSNTEKLYVCIEDELLICDIESGSLEIYLSLHDGTSYALSKDGRYLAYAGNENSTIRVEDIFSGTGFDIDLPENTYGRVVEFMGEDLVYGIILGVNYTEENIQNMLYPLSEIYVCDVSGKEAVVLKEYSKEDRYITNTTKESDYDLSLELSKKIGSVFIPAESDSIQNTISFGEPPAELVNVDDEGNSLKRIIFKEAGDNNRNFAHSLSIKNFDKPSIVYFMGSVPRYQIETNDEYYYAYRGMNIISASDFPAGPIYDAYEKKGYCVDNNGSYIWQFGRGVTKKVLDSTSLGKSEKRRINLYGLKLEHVLSYIYRDCPVYFDENGEDEVIIMGYDQNSITFYQSGLGEEERMLIEEATSYFENIGKGFTTYIILNN